MRMANGYREMISLSETTNMSSPVSNMASVDHLLTKYQQVRHRTEELCAPLSTEDYIPQPIVDVSPPRWHIAHTTWFFETFILKAFDPEYKVFHDKYPYLFNSYYVQAGKRWQRAHRGHLTRPTVDEIFTYRKAVDTALMALMTNLSSDKASDALPLLEIGIHHEQQHQELLLYDIKYILCHNPMEPVYNTLERTTVSTMNPLPEDYTDFVEVGAGEYQIGYRGQGFCYDNEQPAMPVFLQEFALRKGPVTNGEYLQFMEDGGYTNPVLWLDDGWQWNQREGVGHPMYWHKIDGVWHEMTLNGMQPLQLDAPVMHVNFYEAEAFATWAGYRLPTEFEWEVAALECQPDRNKSNLQDRNIFHPIRPIANHQTFYQLYGDVWEWTYSSYLPYHGFRPAEGAIGEYNGKFMVNQMVLRGGSCATPSDHIRKTYRNFFHPDKQWCFAGIRLAR